MVRAVRPMRPTDFRLMIRYFLNADESFLRGMGVDPAKLPTEARWLRILEDGHALPLALRPFYYLIWEADGIPIGHANINEIIFGDRAFMHLHLWHAEGRQRGAGTWYMQECIPRFFDQFKLRELYCQPYAHNPAPNKTLDKLGFQFVKAYFNASGWINFPQEAKLWVLRREDVA